MTDDIHSCSLFCDLPACIKRQRDEYRQGLIDALPVQPAPAQDENQCVRELREYAAKNQGTYIFPGWDGDRITKYLTQPVQIAPVAQAEPAGNECMDITDMLKLESMTPIEGFDEIYKHYSTTFGRTPDAFMQKVVGETKRRLLVWWGAHRETIRDALAAYEANSPQPVKPATDLTDEYRACCLDSGAIEEGRAICAYESTGGNLWNHLSHEQRHYWRKVALHVMYANPKNQLGAD